MKLGYACINTTLASQKPSITTNRSMIKKTFLERGLPYASELGLKNVQDLIKILEWNVENNIFLFRMSSDVLPWASEYDIEELPDFTAISYHLRKAGEYAQRYGIRITSHPGPFVVLTSPKENVVQNSIKDLEIHGKIFDLMGLERSPYNKINIHCNGVYGDKKSAMDRFIQNYKRLSPSVQSRLTVENDDSKNMYSVKDLMYIHNEINIPIVFDAFHHTFNTGGLSERKALELAISSWPTEITPIVHYSESKALHEGNSKLRPQAHSDYINCLLDTHGYNVDIMLECKMKELALIHIRNKLNIS